MFSSVVSMFLCLGLIGGAEEQADVLLDYPAQVEHPLLIEEIGFDHSGNLWMVGKWHRVAADCQAIIIDGKGNKVEYPSDSTNHGFWFASDLLFDRWNNVYFAMFDGASDIHLFRVTPDGTWQDYYPWPNMRCYGSMFMGVLGADTMMLLSYDSDDPLLCRAVKVALNNSGITPICEETKFFKEMPFHIAEFTSYCRTVLQPERNSGIWASIRYPGKTYYDDTLYIVDVDLTFQTEDAYNTQRREYIWRNYVWRTYDIFVGHITISQFGDDGFALFIPDQIDESSTYVLRLDNFGEPINPSELDGGGQRSPRAFDRLKPEFKRYADCKWWSTFTDQGLIRDSARVIFWGCDDEGNLYSFEKTRIYGVD